MPVPIIAGAFSIGGAIAGGFTAVISFFAARMTAKVGLAIGAVAVITGLTVGLIAGLSALGDSLSATLPSDVVAFSAAILPGNLNACISAIVSASVLRWVYDRHVQIVGMFTSG